MIRTVPSVFFMIVRIAVACICGGAVGFERTKRLKEAGVRTHCIIAAGAALLMIISKYGFTDLATEAEVYGTKIADPARVAAQIVSGISFLGAGVIFKNGNSVKGLTTAAGIWATAAVGMAIGCGMYIPGVLGTAMIVAIQIFFHRYSVGNDVYSENDVHIVIEDTPEFREHFDRMVEENHIQIITMKLERQNDGKMVYSVVLRTRKDFGSKEAAALMTRFPGMKSIHF